MTINLINLKVDLFAAGQSSFWRESSRTIVHNEKTGGKKFAKRFVHTLGALAATSWLAILKKPPYGTIWWFCQPVVQRWLAILISCSI